MAWRFIRCLIASDAGDIFQIKPRILETLNQPYEINGEQINIICHVGISLYPHDGSTETNLVAAAETNLKNEIKLYQKQQEKQQESLAQLKISEPLMNNVSKSSVV